MADNCGGSDWRSGIIRGIAYANSEGLLDKFFHNEQTEEVPEQYVEREYIEEDYPNGLKVITNAETKLTFEIEKAITTGDMWM